MLRPLNEAAVRLEYQWPLTLIISALMSRTIKRNAEQEEGGTSNEKANGENDRRLASLSSRTETG